MDTTVADPLLGALVDGRYRVRSRVARGGMATVYSALDERLERTVALKIIHPSQSHDALFVDRFNDEAKTIARLTHPNVVAVYDQGTHEGLPYLVMEYVRGRTLRELLDERRRLQPLEALAIMEQMLAAIAAAHRAGLVHRDVKPENVLVAEPPSGGQNLIDAWSRSPTSGWPARSRRAPTTTARHLMATVAYVAPELVTDGQRRPAHRRLLGRHRALRDAHRPGALRRGAPGRRWPGSTSTTTCRRRRTSCPGCPTSSTTLVARATRRDPGGRPTDAGAMMAEVAGRPRGHRRRGGPAPGPDLPADRDRAADRVGAAGLPRREPRPTTGRNWSRLETRRRRPRPAARGAPAAIRGAAGPRRLLPPGQRRPARPASR